MKEEIEDIVDLMEQAEDFRPIIQKGIEILKSYGPELDEIATLLIQSLNRKRAESFKNLMDLGFRREEAFELLLDTQSRIAHRIKETNFSAKRS
jgi:hypothetical protein